MQFFIVIFEIAQKFDESFKKFFCLVKSQKYEKVKIIFFFKSVLKFLGNYSGVHDL